MSNLIFDEFLGAMQLPEIRSMEEFFERGFLLTADDRFKKFDIALAPWTRTLCRWFEDITVKHIYLVMCSQVSKTTFMLGALLYISQYVRGPVPAMWAMQNQQQMRQFYRKRLSKLLKNQPGYQSSSMKEVMEAGGFQFFNSYLKLGYGTTDDALAGDPCKHVFSDECGKWRVSTSVPKQRIRVFEDTNCCTCFASTPPKSSTHHFIKEAKAGDLYRWFVPCPHCGFMQDKRFSNLKFDAKDENKSKYDQDKVRETARMQCVSCGKKWDDKHKLDMINRGEARPVSWETGEEVEPFSSDTRTMHISSLYTTFTPYGDVAVKFVGSKLAGAESLKTFITDELGEFLEEDKGHSFKESDITKFIDYSRKLGMIPSGCNLFSVGIDVQRRGTAYVVVTGFRSEGSMISGHIVDYACVTWKDDKGRYIWEEILAYLEPYMKKITQVCVDATDGVLQEDIFSFCYSSGTKFTPLRDAGTQKDKFVVSYREDKPIAVNRTVERSLVKVRAGQPYISVNSGMFKNEFASAMQRADKQFNWSFPVDCTKEFYLHLINEKRVIENGKIRWKPKYSGAPQHYFSALIYSMCAMEQYRHALISNIQSKTRGKRN